jgi:hypothetical protein
VTPTADPFDAYSFLRLNALGQFLDDSRAPPWAPVDDMALGTFFKSNVVLPKGVTDVFLWVHGWRNDETTARAAARSMFSGLDRRIRDNAGMYPHLSGFVPAYVAVHWPSMSLPGLVGYKEMRDRAKEMTTRGTAEFLLASLLGYLNAKNHRDEGKKVLRAQAGFYVHCLGHSFGGRFLTAAIQAAARPTERIYKVLNAVKRDTAHPFTVDSLCVLQMAAPATRFYKDFTELLDESPLSGPIVLTHSTHDHALCVFHFMSEWEKGVGCQGALSPSTRIKSIALLDDGTPYPEDSFIKDITNIDASLVFKASEPFVGAHSDLWHPETFHLIASVVDQVHDR